MTVHVGTSPLTNKIYAGRLSKDGKSWGAGKVDVTGAACGAVVEHVMARGGSVVVSRNGEPAFEITVRAIAKDAP